MITDVIVYKAALLTYTEQTPVLKEYQDMLWHQGSDEFRDLWFTGIFTAVHQVESTTLILNIEINYSNEQFKV